MTDDFTGPKPMPHPQVVTPPRGTGNEPIALEHDAERDTWTLLVDDGLSRRGVVLSDALVDALAARVAKPSQAQGIQAQVTVVEWENMGDSAAYVRRPLMYDPDETVADLLERAHGLSQPFRGQRDTDRVELQVIRETVPDANPFPRP